MSEQLDLLREVLPRIEALGVPYMISGSIAAGFYAPPRMTRDIDVVIGLEREGVDAFLTLFRGDFYVDAASVRTAVERRDMFNVIHVPTATKLDFIVRKDDDYRRLELTRRRVMDLCGVRVWVASPEDLILSKLVWARAGGSAQQRHDVRALLGSVTNLDVAYLEAWAVKLHVRTLLDEARS